MKSLAVHRDDCVTCLLFKQMYIADIVVNRQTVLFCKSSLKILFIAIMKKMMPLERRRRVEGSVTICVEYLTVLYRNIQTLNVKGYQLPKYSDTCCIQINKYIQQ